MMAKTLAEALGGKRVGSNWLARCPAHDDRTPSLSISDGDFHVLVYCHAGCDQSVVIDALKERGLWGQDTDAVRPAQSSTNFLEIRQKKQLAVAQRIWEETYPATNTLVERYLRNRGLSGPTPESIRFHPDLTHPYMGVTFPAMVAKVEDDAGVLGGLQRTYLDRDIGHKAPINIPRLALGQLKGNAVRLGKPGATVLLGEGVETVLSAMQIFGLPGLAALSANLLPSVWLGPEIKTVIILADADNAGRRAVQETMQSCWVDGIAVLAIEPVNANDFNDALRAASPSSAF